MITNYDILKDMQDTINAQAKIIRQQKIDTVFLSGCLGLSVSIIFMMAVWI